MARQYLEQRDNLDDLVERMPNHAKSRYKMMRNLRVDSAFLDRIYIIYKHPELDVTGIQKKPQILGAIKVTGFRLDAGHGASLTFMDVATGDEQTVGYVPQQIFDWDCFLSVAPESMIKWDAWDSWDDTEEATVRRRSMSFGVLIKSACRTETPIVGATLIDTFNGFRKSFPQVDIGKF